MNLESLIGIARQHGASDLHLEAGLPAALRVRGALRTVGEPIAPKDLLEAARQIIGAEQWPHFLDRRSFDLSRNIQGVRCRVNILQTSRGVGFAIRLLASSAITLERLNLHPDLRRLAGHSHGLILMSGPTGSGKTSTMAALIQEINQTESRHIVTVESPIEYFFRPKRAFIRQREVGRDTPSFEQALLDALREDPDVLMVGEMRDPETMRLTLNAAETGHLVFATVHSSTCAEALQRVVAAFPSEIQSGVRAQLADCLLAVISQRLRFRPDLQIRIPECEVLTATHAVKAFIRQGDFFKIASAIEIGADAGMWSFQRYQSWIEKRSQWFLPQNHPASKEDEADAESQPAPPDAPALLAPSTDSPSPVSLAKPPRSRPGPGGPIEIEPHQGGIEDLLRRL
jgi:twitching motility protein PilT